MIRNNPGNDSGAGILDRILLNVNNGRFYHERIIFSLPEHMKIFVDYVL